MELQGMELMKNCKRIIDEICGKAEPKETIKGDEMSLQAFSYEV